MKPPVYLCTEDPTVEHHWRQATDRLVLDCELPHWPAQGIVVVEADVADTRLDQLAAAAPKRPDSVMLLVISRLPNAQQGIAAVRLGARGYLHALAHPRRIEEALHALEHGQAWLSQEVIAAMSRQLAATIPNDRWKDGLTEREIQIVEQLLAGHSNKEIANTLHISENTVKTHLKHLFEKFNAKDRLALVLKIQRLAHGETS